MIKQLNFQINFFKNGSESKRLCVENFTESRVLRIGGHSQTVEAEKSGNDCSAVSQAFAAKENANLFIPSHPHARDSNLFHKSDSPTTPTLPVPTRKQHLPATPPPPYLHDFTNYVT